MTIYLDIVFLENICMNYIILFATSYIAKINAKQLRIFVAAILGSIYAVLVYTYQDILFSNIVLKILISISMIFFGFNPKTLRQFLKQLILFYLISFVFGGCAFFLLYFIKPQNILIKNGVYVGKYPLKIALLGAVCGFAITQIAFKMYKTKINRNNIFSAITLFFNDKHKTINALVDTGNMLKDPISNIPVIVVQKNMLYGLFPNSLLDNLEDVVDSKYSKNIFELDSEIASKIRIIPFSSIGRQNGILLGVKIDKIHISTEDIEKDISDIIVGIYSKELSLNGQYTALIGLNIIENGIGETNEYSRKDKSKY